MLLKETFSSSYMKGVSTLGKKVILGTAFCELAGALILSTRFIPMMGFKNGLYTSVFLSVSAFCNAGFDVLGRIQPSGSLTVVNDDPIILLTIAALITIGGLGFIVIDDLVTHKFRFKKLMPVSYTHLDVYKRQQLLHLRQPYLQYISGRRKSCCTKTH